ILRARAPVSVRLTPSVPDSSSSVPDSSSSVPTPHRQFRLLIVSSDSSSSVPTLHRQCPTPHRQSRLFIVSARLLIVSPRLLIVSPRLLIVSPRLLIVSPRLLIASARLLIVSPRLLIVSSDYPRCPMTSSHVAARVSKSSVRPCRPTSWRPTGRLSRDRPQGTEIAGWPVMSNSWASLSMSARTG